MKGGSLWACRGLNSNTAPQTMDLRFAFLKFGWGNEHEEEIEGRKKKEQPSYAPWWALPLVEVYIFYKEHFHSSH